MSTSELARISLDARLSTLHQLLQSEFRWPEPSSGFAAYTLAHSPHEEDLAQWARQRLTRNPDRYYEAPVLASEGYALAIGTESDDDEHQQWLHGVDRLRARDPFPLDRNSFFFRPLELLGLSLGLAALEGGGERQAWLRNVIVQGWSRRQDSDWGNAVAVCAAVTAKATPANVARPSLEEAALGLLGLLMWIDGTVPEAAVLLLAEDAASVLGQAVLQSAMSASTDVSDVAQLACAYLGVRSAIDLVVESSYRSAWRKPEHDRDPVGLVEYICRRFSVFARQLEHRQRGREPLRIADEYDVQYLMYALLRLSFDDVRPEEWTPSYAASASRMDFLLKPEAIVVETKITRANRDQRALVDELLIDIARYRAHQDCRSLVCFVYDPDGRLDNPTAIERDVSETSDRFCVRVVVAPSGI